MKISTLPILIFIILFVLKLTDRINWSWWWVTSPLLIYAVLFILFASVLIALAKSMAGIGFRRL